jgi:hypothetical protein
MKRRKNRAMSAWQYELPFPIGGQQPTDNFRIGNRIRCFLASAEPEFSGVSDDVFRDAARMVLRWLAEPQLAAVRTWRSDFRTNTASPIAPAMLIAAHRRRPRRNALRAV